MSCIVHSSLHLCFQRGTAALYYVYAAMEEEIEKNKDHPHIAPIYFPTELHRREALVQDLEYFYGEDWESQVSRKHTDAGCQNLKSTRGSVRSSN